MTRHAAPALAVSIAALASVALVGCAPDPDAVTPSSSSSSSATADASSTPTPTDSATATADAGGVPTPAPLPTGGTASLTIPSECASLLSNSLQDQLADVPVEETVADGNGEMPAGSLTCVWGDPDAVTTRITTTISPRPHNEMIEYLNALADEGFTCYTPSDGVRCEMTWRNETYPVTDGRTLFFRDGILVDTQYSNLAPTGFTDSIVNTLWPPDDDDD